MQLAVIDGLAEMAGEYDLFIFDLWGVVHNGVSTYPSATDCMTRLRQVGARVVLLSNAPRPSASVAAHLEELGVQSALYDWLLTSGEATASAFASRDPQPAFFHLGPERSRPTLKACGGREVSMEDAELILCTGLFDDETEQAEDYGELLRGAADRSLPMVCANPDIVVMRGDKMIQCAGAVAEFYEKLGGKVESSEDGLLIHPAELHGGKVHTYGDHRMAMSFAVTALHVEGIEIEDPNCVRKSFPGFFDQLDLLLGR